MIEIDAALDDDGLLVACQVRGHANAGAAGTDIVCAAVSILAKTAFRTLSEQEGIELRGGAPERGVFWMETSCNDAARDTLRGIGAFLIEGFRSVQELYPDYCTMKIRRGVDTP